MKYFFRRKIPSAADVLLMESGSPEIARRAIEEIRKIFPSARYHLCTCWPAPPAGVFSSVFRVTDYPSTGEKLRFLLSLRKRRWEVLIILCTGEPILWRWKMLSMLILPAKVLVVNENADFFWLDWGNRKILRRLLEIRWGVSIRESFGTLLRALVFPVTLLILLCTAGFLYARQTWRLLAWKINEARVENPPQAQQLPLSREASKVKNP